MANNNQRRKNKILKLAVVFTFSAVIFSIAISKSKESIFFLF